MAELKYVTIAHFNPHLPDPACIFQGDGDDFQELVRNIFLKNSELYRDTCYWLFQVERCSGFGAETLANLAPNFIKTFLNIYAFGGFEAFIATTTKRLKITNVLPDHRVWTAIKVNNFLLLNIKLAFEDYDDIDKLVVEKGNWLWSDTYNDWAVLPGRFLCRPDRSLILKFESNLCVYYGYEKDRVHRSLLAWAFWKMIERHRRFERLVREQVELAVYHGKRRVINIARREKCWDRIHESSTHLCETSRRLYGDTSEQGFATARTARNPTTPPTR